MDDDDVQVDYDPIDNEYDYNEDDDKEDSFKRRRYLNETTEVIMGSTDRSNINNIPDNTSTTQHMTTKNTSNNNYNRNNYNENDKSRYPLHSNSYTSKFYPQNRRPYDLPTAPYGHHIPHGPGAGGQNWGVDDRYGGGRAPMYGGAGYEVGGAMNMLSHLGPAGLPGYDIGMMYGAAGGLYGSTAHLPHAMPPPQYGGYGSSPYNLMPPSLAPPSDNASEIMPRVNALLGGLPPPLPAGERPHGITSANAGQDVTSNYSYDDSMEHHQHHQHHQYSQMNYHNHDGNYNVNEPKCTLRCTGLKQHVTALDIYYHFVTFGTIVKLELVKNPLASNSSSATNTNITAVEDDKKIYNECFVQYQNESDAKKCFGSPLPVLNNRFVKLFTMRQNLVPQNEVSTFMEFEEVFDGAGKREDMGTSSSNTKWNSDTGKKKWSNVRVGSSVVTPFGQRPQIYPNKKFSWNSAAPTTTNSNDIIDSTNTVSTTNTASSGSENVPVTDESLDHGIGEGHIDSNSNKNEVLKESSNTTQQIENNRKPKVVNVESERQRMVVHKQYEDLRALRQQALGINRNKETLLQVATCRYAMLCYGNVPYALLM